MGNSNKITEAENQFQKTSLALLILATHAPQSSPWLFFEQLLHVI